MEDVTNSDLLMIAIHLKTKKTKNTVFSKMHIDSKDFLNKLARSAGYEEAYVECNCISSCTIEITCNFQKIENGGKIHCKLLDMMHAEIAICISESSDAPLLLKDAEDAFVEKLVALSKIEGFTGFMVFNEMRNKYVVWHKNETIEQLMIRLDLEFP